MNTVALITAVEALCWLAIWAELLVASLLVGLPAWREMRSGLSGSRGGWVATGAAGLALSILLFVAAWLSFPLF